MNVNIDYSLNTLSKIIGGKFINQNSVYPRHIILDSRKVLFPEQSIFFCLNAVSTNSIEFIKDLYKMGVINFVIENNIVDPLQYPNANFFFTKNVLKAFQKLAAFHRSSFSNHDFKVIGITGSNGKTIVKEWLNELLQTDHTIVRSPKSYNSQIGVPLSVLQINATHTLAIFEAGISKPGEMEILEKIIKPNYGILTNIVEAHNSGFESR